MRRELQLAGAAALLLGAAAEGVAAWRLLTEAGAAAALSLHALGALLFGVGLHAGLRPSLRRGPGGPACFVALALCMPVVGALGLLALRHALRRRPQRERPRWSLAPRLALPPLPPAPAGPPADALRGILWHAPDPTRRAEALLRAASLAGPGPRALLRIGLRDSDEDVRLLAHALISRRGGGGAP